MSKPVVIRLLVSMLIGIAVGAALSEISFFFLKETARPPQAIYLTIPAGTAERVARGEQPPSIPESMIFVVGDLLIVRNDDSVDHQLGPLWIPAGAAAHLLMSTEERLTYACSFQPSNNIGLDVREPLTLGTRLYGVLFAGVPLGVLIAIYGFIIPSKKRE
ncbi:MAG: hypothetical protein AB1564_04770 [Chloroflexota bacterium]